ncbi:MAG: hypothetical protein ACFBSE_14525 [Prochloraceae cyanobacterium]
MDKFFDRSIAQTHHFAWVEIRFRCALAFGEIRSADRLQLLVLLGVWGKIVLNLNPQVIPICKNA